MAWRGSTNWIWTHVRPTLRAMTSGNTNEVIELRVDKIAQLFHTLDPFPFRERDLDHKVEEFIVGWARELPIGPYSHSTDGSE